MLHSRLLTALPLLVALMACDENVPTAIRSEPPQPRSSTLQLIGVVEPGQSNRDALFLRLGDETLVPVIGGETEKLARVAGARVSVHGNWSEDTFDIQWFLVVEVGGVSARDGLLLHNGQGYMLRLTGDGAILPLTSRLPDELLEHVGERVWITPPAGSVVAFGVIGN